MQKRSIPLRTQPDNFGWCGYACLYMAYLYLMPNFKTTIKNIVTELEKLKMPNPKRGLSGGVSEYELGLHALKNGFYAREICFDSDFHKREYLRWTQERILKDLKKRLNNFKPNENPSYLKGEVRYLENGGILEVRMPKYEDLEGIVKTNTVPIVSIDRKILYGKGLGDGLHYVIVNNINKKDVIVNDPADGIKTYETEKLMFALWSCKGSILEIGKN